jgi:hypothetical protein
MGLRDWFKRSRSDRRDAPIEMVRFFDAPSNRVVRIPAAELRFGVVQARVEGVDGVVWVTPDQLEPSEIRHPPFDEEVRAHIRGIHAAFAEHKTLTFEQWEDALRRDADPEREIALWMHAADVYIEFTQDEPDPARREDVFRTIVACLTASPDSVWHVLQTHALSRREAQRVIDRFFRGYAA